MQAQQQQQWNRDACAIEATSQTSRHDDASMLSGAG